MNNAPVNAEAKTLITLREHAVCRRRPPTRAARRNRQVRLR